MLVLEIDSTRNSVAQARDAAARFVRENCRWADPAAVALVLSELLTNAVRHATGWWRLRLSADDGRLLAEVRDAGDQISRVRRSELDGRGGLGLHIVEQLVTRLEVEQHRSGTGKTLRALWLSPTADPAPIT
ncbi:ATP-binding protein [Kitasatospora sp. NPDC057223]|uniref:ATP-binding protein n=1 Tax=Kitasatospora sp. NPDC057223 TaxID=3346055 RepID=UPI00362A078B